MLLLERHSVRYCPRGTVCVTVWEKQCALLIETGRGAFHPT